jgi:hypothetical protein
MTAEDAIKTIKGMLVHYGYGQFEIEKKAPPPKQAVDVQNSNGQQMFVHAILPTGQTVLLPAVLPGPLPSDEVYNYFMNLCHWGVHLMQMNDTAKEGDLNRLIVNIKYCMPFFFSHGRLSKYFVECPDYLMKVCQTLSPKQRLRTLEGSFINTFGGKDNKVHYHLRNILKRTNVNGKMKGSFSAHEELLTATEGLLKEQAVQYFGMDGLEAHPTRNFNTDMTAEDAIKTIKGMLVHYGYGQFDIEKKAPPPKRAVNIQK